MGELEPGEVVKREEEGEEVDQRNLTAIGVPPFINLFLVVGPFDSPDCPIVSTDCATVYH